MGNALGNVSSDIISLNLNGTFNASSVKFLLVNQTQNLQTMLSDGILGLSSGFINGDIQPEGELFV